MFGLKNKSLVLSSSIVLAVILFIVIGVTEFLSYNTQQRASKAEIDEIGQTLSYQMEADYALLVYGHSAVTAGTAMDKEDEMLKHLKLQLDYMTKNEIIANAYIYMPEITEREGKSFITMMQTNEELHAAGLGAGDEYEMSPGLAAELKLALATGKVTTEPFTDEYGTWISRLSVIRDPQGKALGVFGVDVDYNHITKRLDLLLWKSISITLLFSAIAIAISVYLIRLVLKPLNRLAEVSSLAAKGDLTLAVPVKGGNEIAQVSLAFNEMIASLRQLTGSIRTTAGEVASSASNMQQSAEQTSRATEEVTTAIQEVASGSDTQLQSFQECQRAMNEMTVGIQRIAESASSVSELAANTNQLASEGEAVISQTLLQMQAIETKVTSTVSNLHELKEQSDKIGSILALIGDVANQTNLLALNASIEAARAGEHGKGFAVVAHEIRKLAERSKESSDQIGAILYSIGTQTENAVASMEQTAYAARTGSDISSQAGESFRSIVASIQDVSNQVQEVSAASEQMSAGSEQIAASLDQLEGITAAAADNSQRVAAASEEQLASMQEVASSSEQLRSLAATLNETVGRFKT